MLPHVVCELAKVIIIMCRYLSVADMKSIQSEPHLLMFVIMSCYFVLWASHPTSDCYLILISVSVHPIYIYISIIYIYIYIYISISTIYICISSFALNEPSQSFYEHGEGPY